MDHDLTIPYGEFSIEAFDASALEIDPTVTVTFEHFNGLFTGLKQIKPKDLQNPKFRESIERRLIGISEHSTISVESLMSEYDGLCVTAYSTESNVFTTVIDWAMKVLNWIVEAFMNFIRSIGKFFSGSKVRSAQVNVNNAVVNGAIKRDRKGKPVMPDIVGVPLPGLILILFHSQKYTPLITQEFNGDLLLKQVGSVQNQMKYLTTKLDSDLDIYIEAVTRLVDLQGISNPGTLDTTTRSFTKARAMRGLYHDGFQCAGFHVVEKPTNSTSGRNLTMYGLKSMDELISSWRATEGIKFTLTLKDYERLNKTIHTRVKETDDQISIVLGKVERCKAFAQLKAMARDRKTLMKDVKDDTLQDHLNQALVGRIELIQRLSTEIIRSTSMLHFYQERYGKLLTELFTKIAAGLDEYSKL